MPSWLPKVPSWLTKNAFCLSQSTFSNFTPQVIKSVTVIPSIICVLRFLECLIANKYTCQIWDRNSHWKSDFLFLLLRLSSSVAVRHFRSKKYPIKREGIGSRSTEVACDVILSIAEGGNDRSSSYKVFLLGHFHRTRCPLVVALSRTAATSSIRKREFLCTGQRALLKYRSGKPLLEHTARTSTPRGSKLISRPIASGGKFT